MAIIPFGEWLPDQAALGNPGVLTAKNVFPFGSGYLPVPALSDTTGALDARPRGFIQARDRDLSVLQYAGDAAKLYQNISGVWTNRSKGGGYTTADGEAWEFTPWKNKVLATNFSDSPQQITMGATAFSDLTTDFKARHITSIRDFVVVANTTDSTDGTVPSRMRWSAFNDETNWTVSASTLSDYQDLKIAPIERIFGGEFGVILSTESVWRMSFIGAPVVFQFDEVLPGIGVISPGAAARDGDTVYFLSDQGFFALLHGTQAQPIGANKIDRYVLGDLDVAHAARISAVADNRSHRVFWAYPGAGNVGGRPNRIVVYDRSLDRWSLIEEDVELLFRGGSTGWDLDTNIDDADIPLDAEFPNFDSRFYIGGAAQIGAFDGSFKMGFFEGPPMTATIETRELELHSGHRSMLNAFRPLSTGGAVTADVGTRSRQIDAVEYGPTAALSATGRFTQRANARYHRLRFNFSGDWQEAIGMQIDPMATRREGRR